MSVRRNLALVGYVFLALGVGVAITLGQVYSRDTRDAVRENRRLALVVAEQTKTIAEQTRSLARQTRAIRAARTAGCDDNNDRWERLAEVIRPFKDNPASSDQQRKTIDDLLRVAEPRDCTVLNSEGTP